jgi:hypothetical protein
MYITCNYFTVSKSVSSDPKIPLHTEYGHHLQTVDESRENIRFNSAIIIYLIMIIIIMRGEDFVAHLDGLGGTPVAHH